MRHTYVTASAFASRMYVLLLTTITL